MLWFYKKFSPDFVWYKCHLGEHSSPSQNLSPYTSLLHQQEHFWPPSRDGLSERKLSSCLLFTENDTIRRFIAMITRKCSEKFYQAYEGGTFQSRKISLESIHVIGWPIKQKNNTIKPFSKTNKTFHQQLAKRTSSTAPQSDWFAVSHRGP